MHPQYRIIRELQRRIVVGRYPVGQRLPTECLLADEFEVSRGTVRRALQRLTDSGGRQRRNWRTDTARWCFCTPNPRC